MREGLKMGLRFNSYKASKAWRKRPVRVKNQNLSGGQAKIERKKKAEHWLRHNGHSVNIRKDSIMPIVLKVTSDLPFEWATYRRYRRDLIQQSMNKKFASIEKNLILFNLRR